MMNTNAAEMQIQRLLTVKVEYPSDATYSSDEYASSPTSSTGVSSTASVAVAVSSTAAAGAASSCAIKFPLSVTVRTAIATTPQIVLPHISQLNLITIPSRGGDFIAEWPRNNRELPSMSDFILHVSHLRFARAVLTPVVDRSAHTDASACVTSWHRARQN